MSQNIRCRTCHEIHPHKAKGLCARCYNALPRIKIHLIEFRARPDYPARRLEYDVRYVLKQVDGCSQEDI